MLLYIIKRLLSVIGTMLLVSVVAFLFIHLIPGEPARLLAGEKAPQETVDRITEKLGLNQPLPVQYFKWMGGILQGDFGESYRTGRPVTEEIFESRYGNTVRLALVTLVWSTLVGLVIGVWAGTHAGKWQDYSSVTIAVAGQAVPSFWIGLVLIFFLGVKLKWLPISSMSGDWKSLIMPTITMGGGLMATVARYTRSAMLETLREDYTRTARAKGLAENTVVWKHAFRNSMITVITIVGVSFGDLLGGSVLVEEVFAYPGIGKYLVDSINLRDYTAVQALILLISAHYVIINLLVDVLYAVINPEIKYN